MHSIATHGFSILYKYSMHLSSSPRTLGVSMWTVFPPSDTTIIFTISPLMAPPDDHCTPLQGVPRRVRPTSRSADASC